MTIYSAHSGSISSVGSTYDVTKYTTASLNYSSQPYLGAKISSIQIYLSSLHIDITSVSIQITDDLAGDNILIPDTQAAISRGLTTTNSGCAVIQIDTILYSPLEFFYIFMKFDNNSGNLDKIIFNLEI